MIFLFIGYGSIAKKHISAIKELVTSPKIFILRHSHKINEVENNDFTSIYSWDEINFKPDCIFITNPTSLHYESILKSIENNCPIFIEKPVLHNNNNIDILLNELNRNKTITYVGCDLRFHPSLIFLKKYITNSNLRINEVNIYCGSFLPEWRKIENYKTSYSAKSDMGGGVHLDLFHEPDYCCWLFGIPIKSNFKYFSKSSIDIESIDYANILFEYNHFCANIILNYYRRDSKRYIEIVTDSCTKYLKLLNGVVFQNDNIIYSTNFKTENLFLDQMSYFLSCVKNKINSNNTFQDSVKILKNLL
jgi:predicted dehydrogenase